MAGEKGTQKVEPKPVFEYYHELKNWGDSFYMPLTKILEKLGIKAEKHIMMKITIYEDGRLSISKAK